MSEVSREEAIEIFKCRSGAEYTIKEINQALDKAISDMEKLQNYETKLRGTYGECDTLLDTVVDGLVKQAEEHKIGQPRKVRLLTDEHVDLWERSKTDRKKLEKVEKLCKDYHKYDGYAAAKVFMEIEAIINDN